MMIGHFAFFACRKSHMLKLSFELPIAEYVSRVSHAGSALTNAQESNKNSQFRPMSIVNLLSYCTAGMYRESRQRVQSLVE